MSMDPVNPAARRCGIYAHSMTREEFERKRAFIDNLCNHVKQHFGNAPCPCCKRPMQFKYNPANIPPNGATRGHLGNYMSRHDRRDWYFQCRQCNTDQGDLTLFAWARKLVNDGDPRDEQVVRLWASVRGWLVYKGRNYLE